MNTSPQVAPFWAPALPRPQLWRSLLGLVLIHLAFFAATFAIIFTAAQIMGVRETFFIRADTPVGLMIFFSTFFGYHLGLWLVVRFLHKRPYRSLFGPALKLRWRHFLYGVGTAVALVAAATLVEWILLAPPEGVTQNLPVGRWLIYLMPGLGLIFVQIMAEELVFRGYLLQQLRARFRSVWIWAALPSLIFGLLHFDPVTYGVNAYFYVLHTTVVGIILSLITLRTGNIGAAAGLHMANNATLLVLGNAGSLDGLSLYLSAPDLTSSAVGTSILLQTTTMALCFAIWWHLTKTPPIPAQAIANAARED